MSLFSKYQIQIPCSHHRGHHRGHHLIHHHLCQRQTSFCVLYQELYYFIPYFTAAGFSLSHEGIVSAKQLKQYSMHS